MNERFVVLLIIQFLLVINGLKAQETNYEPIIPFQPNKSILFGQDITIHDVPNRDQRNVAICSAFNGWLYSVYTYINETNNFPSFTILKSIDNGITWTVLTDNFWSIQNYQFSSMNITVLGDSISNLKVFVAGVINTQNSDIGEALGFTFNGETGAFQNAILDEVQTYDVALATDYNFSANNSNPSGLGVLFSKYGVKDSIIFKSSSNGGLSLNSKSLVALSGMRFHKVALAYGRCLSYPNDNYFAAWEEHENFGAILGHIYTAHTYPYPNSQFTLPINLDSIDISDINQCQNPSIACQYNNINNDSSNLTEIVFFDKCNLTTHHNSILGYYNIQAINHSKFNKLYIADSGNDNSQADVSFNPYDSSFIVTYFDKTNLKLPYKHNNFNLNDPSNWSNLSPGYNDYTNITSPNPKIKVNNSLQKGINVWIAGQLGGNGIALFDSQYNTWTEVPELIANDDFRVIQVFPNPCNEILKIAIKLKKIEKVSIKIFDIWGNCINSFPEKSSQNGEQFIYYDTSNLLTGSYLVCISGIGWRESKLFTKL